MLLAQPHFLVAASLRNQTPMQAQQTLQSSTCFATYMGPTPPPPSSAALFFFAKLAATVWPGPLQLTENV